MADFDEKVAMDVVKDSMGLTDQDLGGEIENEPGEGGEGDFEPGEGGEFEGGEPEGEYHEDGRYESHEGERRQQPQQREQRREPPVRQQQQDPLRQNTLKFDPRASFRQDKKGNLVDNRTGEVIARAGSEARIYQRIHKQASDYIQAASRNIQNTMQAERGKLDRAVEIGLGFEKGYTQLKQQMQAINAYQLTNDQLLEAGQLYKQAQTDPVGVLKQLLTRAALNGVDITQLGMPAGGIDAKGIADMVRQEIQKAVGPMNQFTTQQQERQQQTETQTQYLQQAEREVNTFFNQTPEAVPYMHIFHAVLSQPQFQQMSLGSIWDKVQLHLMRNGVDPRRPPSRSQRQRLNGQQPPAERPRSLPNGQGMAPGGGDRTRGGDAGPAHPSMSYDAIIREVLGNAR